MWLGRPHEIVIPPEYIPTELLLNAILGDSHVNGLCKQRIIRQSAIFDDEETNTFAGESSHQRLSQLVTQVIIDLCRSDTCASNYPCPRLFDDIAGIACRQRTDSPDYFNPCG